MKIRSVRHNNRKKVFEVGTSTKKLVFPFSKATPTPTTEDPVTDLSVDAEAGREAFSYVLHSGRTGTVHVEQVLEYNQDPRCLRDLLLYRLTPEAQKRVAESPLSLASQQHSKSAARHRACLPDARPHGTLPGVVGPTSSTSHGASHRGSDPVQSQPTNRVRAGRQQR